MKKIVIRALSGAVYVGLIVAAILCAEGRFFPLLCTVFALMAVFEFDRLVSAHSPRAAIVRIFDAVLCVIPPLYLAVPVLVPAADIYITTFAVAMLYAAVIMIRIIYTLYSREEHPVSSLAYTFLAMAYIALPLALAAMMSDYSMRYLLLLVFVMIWINDTGAFLTGTAFGRHRLYERLSPKKSWEGFFGGLVFSAATGFVAALVLPQYLPFLNPLVGALLGVAVSVLATWGDLFESLLKRTAGVKDSGHIMPGHGGILDRIDSFLFVIPPLAILIFFI